MSFAALCNDLIGGLELFAEGCKRSQLRANALGVTAESMAMKNQKQVNDMTKFVVWS
jgi:hypothetical protein